MKWIFFLFLFYSAHSFSQEISLNPSVAQNVYTLQELQLLQRLNERHIELLKKEKELKRKEDELVQREKELETKRSSFDFYNKQSVKIYMHLSPIKAVELLNMKPEEDVARILLLMPQTFSARLLDKMNNERVQKILNYMSLTDFK